MPRARGAHWLLLRPRDLGPGLRGCVWVIEGLKIEALGGRYWASIAALQVGLIALFGLLEGFLGAGPGLGDLFRCRVDILERPAILWTLDRWVRTP